MTLRFVISANWNSMRKRGTHTWFHAALSSFAKLAWRVKISRRQITAIVGLSVSDVVMKLNT